MLNVLDEKWKDHLYDLDQLRNAIHYRSWGQKDPLIEYKQEAYTMFVDLMNDIYNTFTERFLKVAAGVRAAPAARRGDRGRRRHRTAPTKRYNALGILEDVVPRSRRDAASTDAAMDIGPDGDAGAPSRPRRRERIRSIVGAGEARSLSRRPQARRRTSTGRRVGRNDPCPCGRGRSSRSATGRRCESARWRARGRCPAEDVAAPRFPGVDCATPMQRTRRRVR